MQKDIKLKEIAKVVNGSIIGDDNLIITGIESLKNATSGQVTFLGNKKYTNQVTDSQASAILVNKDYVIEDKSKKSFIVCDDPNKEFSKVILLFAPPSIQYKPEIHKSAIVAESAKIGKLVHIGANVVIEENVKIADNCIIASGSYIGHNSQIDAKAFIYQNVTIRERCLIGENCIIHSGTVVGSDGFGYAATSTGLEKIPQVGIVQLDNNVEIGSNCTIDRARFGKTWIKHDVKIDNLVQIAHNVIIGEYSIIVAQVGVAGSTELGKGVTLAGQSGVSGHLYLGDGSTAAGGTGVIKDLEPNTIYMGYPAVKFKEFIANNNLPKKVKKLIKRIKDLEEQLESSS